MKAAIITIADADLLFVSSFFAVFLHSKTQTKASNYEKRLACEKRCRNNNSECSAIAGRKKGKEKTRASGICDTFFTGCMQSCLKK